MRKQSVRNPPENAPLEELTRKYSACEAEGWQMEEERWIEGIQRNLWVREWSRQRCEMERCL